MNDEQRKAWEPTTCKHGSVRFPLFDADPNGRDAYCPVCKVFELERALKQDRRDFTEMIKRGCQCICHKHPEHFPFHLLADIPAVIRGHKSHWQETFDRVQRDQLLEDVAKHVESMLSLKEADRGPDNAK